jgi:hypothetical protein
MDTTYQLFLIPQYVYVTAFVLVCIGFLVGLLWTLEESVTR